MNRTMTTLMVLSLWLTGRGALAEVTEYHDGEKAAWESAVQGFSTTDFTGFPIFTNITDQYSHVGVLFAGDFDTVLPSDHVYPNDGWGIDGNAAIELEFSQPMYWIAVDHPGSMKFDLYFNGKLVYVSGDFAAGGVGHFSGLVSTLPFDAAVLYDWTGDPQVDADDIHFGPRVCPADVTQDGVVDVDDLTTVILDWACTTGCEGEVNFDGLVDVDDLVAVITEWGTCGDDE